MEPLLESGALVSEVANHHHRTQGVEDDSLDITLLAYGVRAAKVWLGFRLICKFENFFGTPKMGPLI